MTGKSVSNRPDPTIGLQIPSLGRSLAHLWAILVLGVASLLFFMIQNQAQRVGGSISVAKTLWLHFALLQFFVLPFFLWRNSRLSSSLRNLFGWALASFMIRGILEMILLYGCRGWECIYGILHNLFTLGLVGVLWFQSTRPVDACDRRATGFIALYAVTLMVESWNAWQFSLLAQPSAGIYFAADTEHFRWVNQMTFLALIVLYPWLSTLLWKTRNDFTPS